MMKLLNFIKEKIKKKKPKTKTKVEALKEKKLWLEGEGPQTD